MNDAHVPLTYFNIVKLARGDRFQYATPGYETCIVPDQCQIDVVVADVTVEKLGLRGDDVWDGEPEGLYVPSGVTAEMICLTEAAEIFVAGAKFDQTLTPLPSAQAILTGAVWL